MTVFIHSMWRTGSTYFASRFDADDCYVLFYEPFHETIGSRRLLRQSAATYDQIVTALHHPKIKGGYFGSYELLNPTSQRPVRTLYRDRFATTDVYNGLSREGNNYIHACISAAAANQKRAVLGFCRSGLQVAGLKAQFHGLHIYLFRNPREQFQSYKPDEDSYFLPWTLIQLANSRDPEIVASREILFSQRSAWLLISALSKTIPVVALRKVAARAISNMTMKERYTLFFLSWLISNRHGRNNCELSLSLNDLVGDAVLRERMQNELHISFEGLQKTPLAETDFKIDHDKVERDVKSAVG